MTSAAVGSHVIRREDVDGVPVFWSELPGVARAVLAFRTGRADESLITNGVTHLVEHLALRGLGSVSYQFNGATGALTTFFLVNGSPGDVVEFFRSVSSALSLLPPCPDEERSVLEVEGSERPYTAVDHVLRLRFGATGWALGAYREFALRRVGDPDLRAWANGRFTKENAVAFMSCPPPEGLAFPLEAGARRPLPPHDDLLAGRLPAFCHWQGNSVAVSWMTGDSPACQLSTMVLRERAQTLLRNSGLSYGVSAQSMLLDPATAMVTLVADGKPTDGDRIFDHLRSSFDSLAIAGPSNDEMVRQRAIVRNQMLSEESRYQELMACAMHELLGTGYHLGSAAVDAFEQVTAQEVAAALGAASSSTVYLLPSTAQGGRGVARLHRPPATPVHGKRCKPLKAGRHNVHKRLVVGETGVSVLDKSDCVTVSFDRLAAALVGNDGVWTLIGDNGDSIRVDETRWLNVSRHVKRLASVVPADKVVSVPEDRPLRTGRSQLRRALTLVAVVSMILIVASVAGANIGGNVEKGRFPGCSACSPVGVRQPPSSPLPSTSPTPRAAAPDVQSGTSANIRVEPPTCGSQPPATTPALLNVTYQLVAPADPGNCVRSAGLALAPRRDSSTLSHAHLDLYLQGGKIVVPAGIGVTAAGDKSTSLTTSAADGVIAIVPGSHATLGQFFTEWGHPLGERSIGSLHELDGREIQWFVNGVRVGDPRAVVLQNHDEVFGFEDMEGAPVSPVTSYRWAAG